MLKKVTMNLTDRDIEITDKLTKRLHSRSKASTVSSALAITDALADLVDNGGTLLVRGRDGSMERLIIPGLRHG